MKSKLVTCPECGGQKGFMAGHNDGEHVSCITCGGKGVITKKISALEEKLQKIRNDNYVGKIHNDEVCLDGYFSIDNLKTIIKCMKNVQ